LHGHVTRVVGKIGALPKIANVVKDYLLSKKLLSLKMAQKRAENVNYVMYVIYKYKYIFRNISSAV